MLPVSSLNSFDEITDTVRFKKIKNLLERVNIPNLNEIRHRLLFTR